MHSGKKTSALCFFLFSPPNLNFLLVFVFAVCLALFMVDWGSCKTSPGKHICIAQTWWHLRRDHAWCKCHHQETQRRCSSYIYDVSRLILDIVMHMIYIWCTLLFLFENSCTLFTKRKFQSEVDDILLTALASEYAIQLINFIMLFFFLFFRYRQEFPCIWFETWTLTFYGIELREKNYLVNYICNWRDFHVNMCALWPTLLSSHLLCPHLLLQLLLSLTLISCPFVLCIHLLEHF